MINVDVIAYCCKYERIKHYMSISIKRLIRDVSDLDEQVYPKPWIPLAVCFCRINVQHATPAVQLAMGSMSPLWNVGRS